MERSDGLLRGSRHERIRLMRELREQAWSLDTLLDAHAGLLDHSHEVQAAAVESLLRLAAGNPPPLRVDPRDLIEDALPYFTRTSCVRANYLLDVLEHGAAPSRVAAALGSITSNDEFAEAVRAAVAAGHAPALAAVDAAAFSPNKQRCLGEALGETASK